MQSTEPKIPQGLLESSASFAGPEHLATVLAFVLVDVGDTLINTQPSKLLALANEG